MFPMPVMNWIFAGSRVLPEVGYGADAEGYVVSIVNFELTLIDVPKLASSANETLEWETNLDIMPPLGSPMTMIIEPLDKGVVPPATMPAMSSSARLSDVTIDQEKVDRMRQLWETEVKPRSDALQKAAEAQYEVIGTLRREQQRLIDEADRIQRLIDQMEQDYQKMTTPRPEGSREERK